MPDPDILLDEEDDEEDTEISPDNEDAEISEDESDDSEGSPPPPRENDPPPGPRYAYLLRLKIGDRVFSNQEGDFIGQARLQKSDSAFCWLKATLYDPDGSILESLSDNMDVEIEIGFADGERRNTMVGFFHEYGRKPPNGTLIVVKDVSATLSDSSPTTVSAGDEPEPEEDEGEDSEDSEDNEEEADEIGEDEEEGGEEIQDEETGLTEEDEEAEKASRRRPGLGSMGLLLDHLEEVSRINRGAREQQNPINLLPERRGEAGGMLRFSQETNFSTGAAGLVNLGESLIRSASRQAAQQGETLVVRGNEVREVQPGSEIQTGIHFDWTVDRNAFIATPECKHITNKGRGTITVVGYDTSGHQQVSATVNTPGQSASPSSAGSSIAVPGLDDIKLDDPIYDGCSYTWGDATKNGQRMPVSQEIVQGIVHIAEELQKITQNFNSGTKITVTSWYRDPASNEAAGGSSQSRHMSGDAVDIYFAGMQALYDDYNESHPGGVAIASGSFIHVDMRHLDGGTADRWTYW
jgi:hypothetical protein